MDHTAKKKKPIPLKILIGILTAVGIILLAAVGFIAYLSVTEYYPKEQTEVLPVGKGNKHINAGDSFTVMSWNIGYGALGDNADFFMDGGKSVKTADSARVEENMKAIMSEIDSVQADAIFLQETDRDSDRSSHLNEAQLLSSHLPNHESTFASNFKVPFVPYPLPPIGKVDSGIQILSAFPSYESYRVPLPCPFNWPIRVANLKRCLLVNRIHLDNSDHDLVLVNLHLEAYDSGEGKIEQTKQLVDFLESEYAAGNYVIAGGDFNQSFSNVDTSKYPLTEGLWQCGEFDTSVLSDGWQCMMDNSVPTCRSLDKPYVDADKSNFQYYLIDGFIVSPNVNVTAVRTKDLGFKNTDHNPVVIRVTLEE